MNWLSWSRWRDRLAPEGPLRRIVTNAAVLGTGKAANAVFSLAYLAFTARALGIETMGLLILVHAYAQAMAEVARLRSWEAVLRFGTPALQSGARGDFLSLIRFTARLDIASSIGSAVLAVAGCAVAARLLDWPAHVVPPASVYCLVVLFIGPATPTGLLRLFNRFDLLAIQSTMVSFVRMIGAASLLLAGGGLVSFLVVWFVATLSATAALVAFAWRELDRRGLSPRLHRGSASIARARGIWRFVWITNLNATVTTISTQVPTLLAGGLLGAAEAALYRVARELAEALAKPAKLLVPTIFPELAQLVAAGAVQPIRTLVGHSMRLAALAAFAALVALWLAGELLLRVVVGEPGVPAYGLMLLLGISSLLRLVAFPLEPLLISAGLETSALTARATATLLHIGLIFAIAPVLGLMGTGIAALSAAVLMIAGQGLPVVRWLRAAGVTQNGHFPDEPGNDERALAPLQRGP